MRVNISVVTILKSVNLKKKSHENIDVEYLKNRQKDKYNEVCVLCFKHNGIKVNLLLKEVG